MKNLLKKFHIMSSGQSEDKAEGSTSSRRSKLIEVSSSDKLLSRSRPTYFNSEHEPFSGISGWLNSVTNRRCTSPTSSSDPTAGEIMEPSVSMSSREAAVDTSRRDSRLSNSRDHDIEEENQIQLALEMSAREDPEAAQIEAVKQISLGSCDPANTPAEVIAFRYWNYNSLSYDDKILDGFYDLYGVFSDSTSERMPSLVDLQGAPMSDSVTWEAVLINKAADANLLKLGQTALEIAIKTRSESPISVNRYLVRKLAVLVSDHMGGPVGDPEKMLRKWRNLSYSLKATLGSMVFPLGSLTVGMARHRALLFKLLADGVDIPCRLVKGPQYTGSDDVAMNFVKIDDGREYIVDLMADPGTLIPADVARSLIEYDESAFSVGLLSRDVGSSQTGFSSCGVGSSLEENLDFGATKEYDPPNVDKGLPHDFASKPNYPGMHVRSPSWTEGVSSPAVRRMKVKDVSQYMIDAAKENPRLAQKLHDVLLESGVVAPPNLFTGVYPDQIDVIVGSKPPTEDKDQGGKVSRLCNSADKKASHSANFLPPLPQPRLLSKASPTHGQQQHLKPLERNLSHDSREAPGQPIALPFEVIPVKYGRNRPVAAAAAATAAVVASSMVVAAAKSTEANLEIPVSAAATATAAAVVATTAAVNKQYEQVEADAALYLQHGSGDREQDAYGENSECERISDRSAGNESTKSDITIDDVAECEIPWEDISLGERIGLGSYGEVYHGDWHGTEVAVKRFLDQDISGESLEDLKSEVRIMKRLRHPNVVLFMGAVTRAPNLSIVTEFLPRGSLYRLIHRPNNQLDEQKRLRMALDAARGMNYLHNCTPVVVHRDLKSPNLLVDRNRVVKVCDFGLSKMKHSTFLSSRSTAGTAEWMAPEVLRNEPSDEKCDVYSYGVILWELSTMKQPWGGMNPMQVVGAVGFQHRRLDIPDNIDPAIADIIRKCWQTDPRLRPSFAEILAALKPLQKPMLSSQVPRRNASAGSGRSKARLLQVAEDPLG
ncbi:probable serine/threonine-protein kinase SIS8 [Cucurbita moschata]|uniref:non-specific serine/threonine protein kinase n=1 Tax=Cucurbita moschata TaxID=3662 RepID=A0A6J1GSM3_CUCMO|nr:probable serine/threonine-protein kinase SIS8 [Cucurbita moschata]